MFNLFSWLRSQVRAAFLAGIDDAMRESGLGPGIDADADGDDATSSLVAAIRARATALPEPSKNGAAKKAVKP